jgi:EpsI family protein
MIRRRDMLGLTSLAIASAATAGSAQYLRSNMTGVTRDRMMAPDQLPSKILEWHLEPGDDDMVSPVEFDGAFREALEVYDRITAVTYASETAPAIMLNLAYKRSIRQEDRFHWPEFCYTTQGYDLAGLPAMQVAPPTGPRFRRFSARSAQRSELVAYLVSIGDSNITTPRGLRWLLLRDALALKIPDGLLFRASVELDASPSPDTAWAGLSRFLEALLPQVSPALRNTLRS